jgi:glucosyl-dolichyl phosphate glucuronosyltransferase
MESDATAMITLDVVVPTRNRASLLARALDSLMSAPVPDGLDVRVVVVDNGSTDTTPSLLGRMGSRHPGRIRVVHERRCGKSRALNAGIAASRADLIGMIDDDEEVGREWFVEIARAFRDPYLDFIGGPYVPRWGTPPPAWIPPEYLAVFGAVNTSPVPREYGPQFPGILKGGNAVIRREVLVRGGTVRRAPRPCRSGAPSVL